MKTISAWRYLSKALVVLITLGVAGCDMADEPLNNSSENKDETKFDIQYNLSELEEYGTADHPAIVQQGDTLNIVINQTSSYADSDGSVYTCQPKATLALWTMCDTIYVTDVAALKDMVVTPETNTSKNGDNPVVHRTTQTFSIGDQKLNFDLSYEVYSHLNKENKVVEMPYLKVNPASTGKAQTTDNRAAPEAVAVNAVSLSRNDDNTYEVTVSFSALVETVNTASDNQQYVNFEAKYTAVVETPQLQSVYYRQSYDWEEPHHNIEINYGFYVYRDRIYTDGTILTDTIRSPRFFSGFAVGYFNGDCSGLRNGEGVHEINDSISFDFSSQLLSEKYQNTDNVIIHGTVGVDDLSKLETEIIQLEGMDDDICLGEQTWSDYKYWCGCYAENCEEPLESSTQNFPTTDSPNGWYQCVMSCNDLNIAMYGYYYWNNEDPNERYKVFHSSNTFAFHVLTLVIDHKIITFDEWLPTSGLSIIYYEPYPSGYYKAKPGTTVMRSYFYNEATFLDRKFLLEVETLCYERDH